MISGSSFFLNPRSLELNIELQKCVVDRVEMSAHYIWNNVSYTDMVSSIHWYGIQYPRET